MGLMNLNTSENGMTHSLKLRSYQKEDAELICKWLRTEEELYRWSADRFNRYPLTGNDINENYAPQLATGRFYPADSGG